MVDFAVFNELSLPLKDKSCFKDFFLVLEKLKENGLCTIRMEKEFKEYSEIFPKKTLQEIFPTLDRDEKERLRIFINNKTSIISSPLIKDEEIDDNILSEYSFNENQTFGGLACCDIWDTISISFNSDDKWNTDTISLKKNNNSIDIRHSSKLGHLTKHKAFFDVLEKEIKLNITQSNFWDNRTTNFPNKIIFCPEIEKQINNLDGTIFKSAISILRDIETSTKNPTDFNYSGESKTVKDNPKFKSDREFTIDGKKTYFDNHIKSLPDFNRIYYLEQDSKIYIGYIGKHLSTKKYK